ncbi:hypothetical protein Tco_0392634 [Tanacetum coccineum]|uniref:Uncharacterized protein n=1 Tax=Tanacetum coccineum TaxID=301880 RepID=A0ABQ4WLC4_9ASTR
MHDLEEISRFSDAEDDGAEAEMTNLDTHIVSPIHTTIIHKDHPVEQVIGDIQSNTSNRRMKKRCDLNTVQKGNPGFEGSKMDGGYTGGASAIQITTCLDLGGFTIWQKGHWIEDLDSLTEFAKLKKVSMVCIKLLKLVETLSTYLLENRFQEDKLDKTLFIKRGQGDILILQGILDDIILVYKEEVMHSVEKMMHKNISNELYGLMSKASKPMEEKNKPLLKDADGEDYIAASNCCGQINTKVGWMSGKAAKDGIGVKTGNSRVNAVGHYLVLLGKNEAVHKRRGDNVERAATNATSLDAKQDNVEEGEVQVPTADMEVNTASAPVTTAGVSVSTTDAYYMLVKWHKSKGELSVEEKSRLFVELMDKRKKHFARLKAEERRRKPPTKLKRENKCRIEQITLQSRTSCSWDVIENGNSFKPAAQTTTNADGTLTTLIPGPDNYEEKQMIKRRMHMKEEVKMVLQVQVQVTYFRTWEFVNSSSTNEVNDAYGSSSTANTQVSLAALNIEEIDLTMAVSIADIRTRRSIVAMFQLSQDRILCKECRGLTDTKIAGNMKIIKKYRRTVQCGRNFFPSHVGIDEWVLLGYMAMMMLPQTWFMDFFRI